MFNLIISISVFVLAVGVEAQSTKPKSFRPLESPLDRTTECRGDRCGAYGLVNEENRRNYLEANRDLEFSQTDVAIKSGYLATILQAMKAEERRTGDQPSKLFNRKSISETLLQVGNDGQAVRTIERIVALFTAKLNRQPDADPEVVLVSAAVDIAELRFKDDPEKERKIREFIAGAFDGCLFVRPSTSSVVAAMRSRGQG